MTGRLALILHAHLPFVRHPEHVQFYEESWLFEAVAECYLPLLRAMDGWTRDGLSWRLTLTLTPTLCAMLRDPLLQTRCARYLDERLELAERELDRTVLSPELHAVAQFYHARFLQLRSQWDHLLGDLVAAFAQHQRNGHLEILTCAATHALLPLWQDEPTALRAQLAVAAGEYRRHFGQAPRGLWLPECAWVPELEPALRAAGLGWFVLETHGVLHASPRPRCASFAPLLTPGGLAAFGRDPASARQVWSRDGGYPGDPRYREFHQDLAHDAEWEYVRAWQTGGSSQRVFTGLKYHRVTGGGVAKEVYDRQAALQAVAEHARHFVEGRRESTRTAAALLAGRPPLLAMPYDAELFGHWWFEGPEFLDAVMRIIAAKDSELKPVNLGGFLAEFPDQQVAMPATSSWGEGGHLGVWLHPSNAWMQPLVRQATRRFVQFVERHAGVQVTPELDGLLRQAARELLLAQASDWPFLLKMGTAGEYPARRFQQHLDAVAHLLDAAEGGRTEAAVHVVADLEARHNLFPGLDWRLWAR